MIKLLRVFFGALILCTLISYVSFAQDIQHCGQEQYMQHLSANRPAVYKQILELEKQLANRQAGSLRTSSLPDVLINIPVVVHVIHSNSSGAIGGANNANISDQQIQSQIAVLNQDYQRLNADAIHTPAGFLPVAANCKLSFCLATTDPSGNTTTGITRTYSTKAKFTINDEVALKALSYWPSDQYLNIWVCDLLGIPSSQLLLGYAQKPGAAIPGLSPADGDAATDGVVINYKAFGTVGTLFTKFNLGRTATHEVGHWFGLSHPWGEYNSGDCSLTDYCADTPPCANGYESSSPACAATPPITCTSTRMIQNYMEYSDDACMNLFTQDQKTRIRSSIELSARRAALLNSLGCCTIPELKKIPLVKNFEDGSLTSDGWIVTNPNSASPFTPGFELSTYSGYGEGNYSTAVANDSVYAASDPATHKYMFSLESPYINIHNAHTPVLRFDWAYCPQDLPNVDTDSVVVYIATGCNNSWAVLKTFYGSDFRSTQDLRPDFSPGPKEWRTTELNLGSYIQKPAVRIKFVSYSKGINTFYLDNINFGLISHTLAVNVYPNPTSNILHVQTIFEGTKNVDYIVYNTLGQLVHQDSDQHVYSTTKELDLSFLASGVYFVLVSDGDEKIVKRIVKQ